MRAAQAPPREAAESELRALGEMLGEQLLEMPRRVLLMDGRGEVPRAAALASALRVCILATASAARAITGADRPSRADREAWEAIGALAAARCDAPTAEILRLCERWRVECEQALARSAVQTCASQATVQRAHSILAATLAASFAQVGEALAAG